MQAIAKQANTRLKITGIAEWINDHVMHVTYWKENTHAMIANLPHQIENSAELEQAISYTEL